MSWNPNDTNSGLDPKTAILIDNLIQEITQEYQITAHPALHARHEHVNQTTQPDR